jgi:hypothetical protein
MDWKVGSKTGFAEIRRKFNEHSQSLEFFISRRLSISQTIEDKKACSIKNNNRIFRTSLAPQKRWAAASANSLTVLAG